jgi:2-phospho-L-lactate guanylyltransferase
MPRESVWAVVVARVGHGAKSRLSPVLDPDQRRALALAMLADVLGVCASARLDGVIAVVDDALAARTASATGAVALEDEGADMNAAVALGLRQAAQRGASTAIVLPGDIPLISRDDVCALQRAAGDAPRAVVIAPSRDGQGTNALLLRPLEAIGPAFGPPSVERHVRLGLSASAEVHLVPDLGLSMDVDTPIDLAQLADLPVGPHTADFLANPRILIRN